MGRIVKWQAVVAVVFLGVFALSCVGNEPGEINALGLLQPSDTTEQHHYTTEPEPGIVMVDGVVVTTQTESATTQTESATTQTTEASLFAGTYMGTIPYDMTDAAGKVWAQFDIPWEFTIDAEGNVKGGFDYSQGGLTLGFTFTGWVSQGGAVLAEGTSTATNSYGTNSGNTRLDGNISERGVFAGIMVDESSGDATPVTAKRR